MKTCTNYKTKFNDNNEHCSKCGTPLKEKERTLNKQTQNGAGKMSTFIIGVLLVMGLLFVESCAKVLSTKGVKKLRSSMVENSQWARNTSSDILFKVSKRAFLLMNK
jgi:uncharacterized membrane protein YvbJ